MIPLVGTPASTGRSRVGSAVLIGLVVVASLLIAVSPDRSERSALATGSCPTGTGYGGQITADANNGLSQGGHGCVIIVDSTGTTVLTHTGAVQQWTVPAGVTSIEVHLIGAGGGAGLSNRGGSNGGNGGGGGYATGALTVSPGAVYDVIVGQGGRHMCVADMTAIVGDLTARRNFSFGGGAAGYGGGAWDCSWASGGGRSALRTQGGTDDLITAGGGGGGGFDGGSGGAGGGLTGLTGTTNIGGANPGAGTGGTQVAGGVGGACGENGYDGIKYAGGPAGVDTGLPSEAGGGGGGYYGGGGGCNNKGGGGGSSFVGGVASGSTTAGSGRTPGAVPPANTAVPTIGGTARVGNVLTATTGTWTGATSRSFKWQSSSDGTN